VNMLNLETKADLERLIADEVQESLTLDYKASQSLGRSNNQRNELTKDVSAFANSAGGQIVYGIEESNRKPVRLDAGLTSAAITREWIEQTIDTNVHPRIEGLTIRAIPLTENAFAYVLNIPAGVTRAPHQALDHKYYKRQNFQSVPMEDYEIRDIFRRATNAELFATISFVGGLMVTDVDFIPGTDLSVPIKLDIVIQNNSPQPAYYWIITMYIDSRLRLENISSLNAAGQTSYWYTVCAISETSGNPVATPNL
jgi:hypothetical protein